MIREPDPLILRAKEKVAELALTGSDRGLQHKIETILLKANSGIPDNDVVKLKVLLGEKI